MTTDEELEALRQANRNLREQVASLSEALTTATKTINSLQEQVKHLQEQQAKDSHNSSLPPSSDRFVRRPKRLRKKSGKKPAGQAGHPGHHLRQVAIPDEIVRHRVQRCEHCACDLSGQQASVPERRRSSICQPSGSGWWSIRPKKSAGSIARFVRQCHQPWEPVEAALKAALTRRPVLNSACMMDG
jgi:hypothetical protein